MAQTVTPLGTAATARGGIICLTGFVRRAEPIGIIQRGTHRLVDASGNVVAALNSNVVNLFGLEGRFLTVCGVDEGVIVGVRSILVTQVFPAAAPAAPIFPQIDPRLLLLILILTQPGLLRGIRPEILLTLLLTSGLGGLLGLGGIGGLGLGGLAGLGGLGGLGLGGLTGFGGLGGLGTLGGAGGLTGFGGLTGAQVPGTF